LLQTTTLWFFNINIILYKKTKKQIDLNRPLL
jgi:hypothetical protein